ncbi:MAG TPA: ATP-binding protein [Pyrinomonadaceae bacterium]|nr:ATP-binding protein [Pyrinomonadaceae bacterium]
MVQAIPEEHLPQIDQFQLIPPVVSGLGVGVSCLVLAGWAFDLSALRSVIPGQPQMVPNTAISFILASVSLWMLWRAKRNEGSSFVAWICAFAVILIGLLTIGEYLIRTDLGLDRLLFRQKLSATGMSFPGRPSPHTAFNFLLIGFALLLIGTRSVRAHRLAQVFALLGALIALMALVGYVYQVAFLYSITTYTGMALHTALIFVILSAGILFIHPERGLMSFVMSDSAGGVMVRRLLPATIVIPAAGGALIMLGARQGLYDMAFGTLLCVWGSILILTTLIWRNARALHRSDAKRKQVEEALRRAYDDLELRVTQRTVELSKVNETLRAEVIEHKKSETARGQLLRQLVTAQEEERRRISRELHDQMGQHLNALMLGLKNLSASCGNGGSPHKNSFHRLQELTEQLMEKTHNLAWELRPAALDDLGLQTALSNYVEKWSARSGITTDFHTHGLDKQRLPPPIETAVYRIVQEALNNVLKHAGANRVSVILELRQNQLRAIVEDDGQGFDVDALRFASGGGRGLGLLGIQERVASIDGNLKIESYPSRGTTLVTRIPVHAFSFEEGFLGEYTANLSGR